MSMISSDEKITRLEAEIAELKALIAPRPRRRLGRQPWALAAIAILAIGTLAGGATAAGSTTNVKFVLLSPVKLLLSNTSIASHKSTSPVVIGGTTTVPSNATTVELTVSAKGAVSGTLNFYPALNASGGSGQTLTYPRGNVLATTTIQENIGQSGELTFYNGGSGTAVVTAKIIGYSTQVTAGDINGTGGGAGQVLTNDGSGGAIWQTPTPPPVPSADNFSGSGGASGQVLTNTGTGAKWADAGVSGDQLVYGYGAAAAGSWGDAYAWCPAGKVAVGGGVLGFGGYPGADVISSAPWGTTAWYARVDNTSSQWHDFTLEAVCVNGSQ